MVGLRETAVMELIFIRCTAVKYSLNAHCTPAHIADGRMEPCFFVPILMLVMLIMSLWMAAMWLADVISKPTQYSNKNTFYGTISLCLHITRPWLETDNRIKWYLLHTQQIWALYFVNYLLWDLLCYGVWWVNLIPFSAALLLWTKSHLEIKKLSVSVIQPSV